MTATHPTTHLPTASSEAAADPQTFLDLDELWCAHNYHPLPVVIASAEGAWVTDVAGKRYLDMLAGYSALNFGHRHPALIAAAVEQMRRVDPDLPGVPPRPARPVLRGTGGRSPAPRWCCR